MPKARRLGKVFIDWSQNNAKKTTISPYSLRGTFRPFVAAPRTWDELADPDLVQLEFGEVLDRFEVDGDLLSGLDLQWMKSKALSCRHADSGYSVAGWRYCA